MAERINSPKLKLMPYHQYKGAKRDDPLRFYYWPFIGKLYRRRVELCLAECKGGERVLEIGFGSGVTFFNLHEHYDEIHGLDLNASIQEVSRYLRERNIEAHIKNGDMLCMPYEDDTFDTVLLISILEHLKPDQQIAAFQEIRRVLKPGGQAIYGVPIERRLMRLMFRLLGYKISDHHFSTERDVFNAANRVLSKVQVVQLQGIPAVLGPVYETGHFMKSEI